MAYSIDFIKRAVAYKQEGHSFKQLREAFAISSTTYYDWAAKLQRGFEFSVKEYAEQCNCTPSAVYYTLVSLNITRKKVFTY